MKILNYKLFLPKENSQQKNHPIFILHGLLGAMDNWRSQAKLLSQSRPVYTLDLRNHGNSPHLKGMSYREMYEDVIQLAAHLNIKHFHLLGHSMGGKVAMQLALARPEIIQSLIVVDIAPKTYPLWHQKTLQGIMSAPVENMHSRQEIDQYLIPWIEDESERTFMLKNLKRLKKGGRDGFEWKCNLEEITKGYLKIVGFSTALQTYLGKTLFIKGGQSNYIQASDTTIIKQLFPNAEIFTLNESGHLPHIQQSELFFTTINSFLSQI